MTFCSLGKSGFFAESVDLQKLEPILVVGIVSTLTYSQVKAAMESGLIISIKTMTYQLRCLERKSKSMTTYEVSGCSASLLEIKGIDIGQLHFLPVSYVFLI